MKYFLSLTMFDGEGTAPASEGTSVTGGDAAATEVGADTAQTVDTAQQRPSFKDLINGDYKQEADEYIQSIVKKRVDGYKHDRDILKAQGDILNIVASKYGMDTKDLNALKEKVSNDDAYYEEKAIEEGLTVDQYKRIAQAEAKSREFEAQIQAQQQEAFRQEQFRKWSEEEQKVKSVFPEFDFRNELQNPTFEKLMRSGVDMQSAYVALHNAEIMSGAMQYTAEKVRKATADEIASKGQRPRENASSSNASASMKVDVSKLTKADREAYSRRAMSGEIISFS